MTTNPFLPNFDEMPHHDTPRLADVNLTHAKMATAIEESRRQGVDDAPAELLINGRQCGLTGDAIDDWYLAETLDGDGQLDKFFYLLPRNREDLVRQFGDIPTVRSEEKDFDTKYEGWRQLREIRWYFMGVLMSVTRR